MNKTLFTVTPSLIGTDFVELVEYTSQIEEVDLLLPISDCQLPILLSIVVKLAIGNWKSAINQGVMMLSILITSKFERSICFKVFRSSSFQRGSGAPLMNQFEPLSARIMPYFFSARRARASSTTIVPS